MDAKTLIGKNNILFLCNDSAEELDVHCSNKLKIHDLSLSRYTFNNYSLFVYPDKTVIFKYDLPDNYVCKYRPALDIYKDKFKDKIHDLYDILKIETDVYYKTDTHINIKGNYLVYKYFIEIINKELNINIKPKIVELLKTTCELKTLPYGIGDLTWESNLGNQILTNIDDTFYYHNEITWFYNKYRIQPDTNIRILNYNNVDCTSNLVGEMVDWNIISKNIIHVHNTDKVQLRIIIFYDSFLLHVLPLYFSLFNDVYFIKNPYSNEIIEMIKPNYVIEFMIERFLF